MTTVRGAWEGATVLRLAGVRYRYPGAARDALSGVSLSVDTGEFR